MRKDSIVQSQTTSIILRVFLYVSIAALLALVFYIYHEQGWKDIIGYYRYFLSPKRLQEFVASFGPYGSIMFVIIQAFQVVFAPVPGEVTGFVGGLLFGKTWGTVLSTIGLTFGSILAFGITRAFGLRFVEKVVKKQYIDKFNFFVTHKGLYVTFILFLIPGFPKDSLCYLLGLTRLRLVDFIFMNVLGRLPGTLILSFQGDAVRHGKYHTFFELLVVSIVLIIGLYIARDHMIRFFGRIVRQYILRKRVIKRRNLRKKKNNQGQGSPVISKKVK